MFKVCEFKKKYKPEETLSLNMRFKPMNSVFFVLFDGNPNSYDNIKQNKHCNNVCP